MYVNQKPKLWLRLDGLVLFIATIVLFASQHQRWWLYPVLLFLPDIFMLGYIKDTKVGAFFYNLGHSYLLPTIVVLAGWQSRGPLIIAVGGIWQGHIGWDRLLGYGLKYDSHFRHTHLGLIGKKAQDSLVLGK